jgi:hypothetical protein
MRLGKKSVLAIDYKLSVGTCIQGSVQPKSSEVSVKTVLDFASVFTSSRNDGRLDELLVEREVAVVENDGKTALFF